MPFEKMSPDETLQVLGNLGATNPQHALRLSEVEGLDHAALDVLIREGRLRHTLFDDQLYYVPVQTMDYFLSPAIRRFSYVMSIVITVVVAVLILVRGFRP